MQSLRSSLAAASAASISPAAGAVASSTGADAVSWSHCPFRSVERELADLAAMDAPAMAQAHFFLQLQQEKQQMREQMVKRLLAAMAQAVQMRIADEAAPESKETEVEEEKEQTQQTHARRPAALSAGGLEVSVQPLAALSLSTLFTALHVLCASAQLTSTLGDALLRVLRALLAFVSTHGGLALQQPLLFSTQRQAGGRMLRVQRGAQHEGPARRRHRTATHGGKRAGNHSHDARLCQRACVCQRADPAGSSRRQCSGCSGWRLRPGHACKHAAVVRVAGASSAAAGAAASVH